MTPRVDVLSPAVRDWMVGHGDCPLIVTKRAGCVTIGKQEMEASSPCMKMASCAAKAKTTYSA